MPNPGLWKSRLSRRVGGLFIGVLLTGTVFASTLYLPLDAPIAPDAERLAVVSRLAMISKPYPISALREEAERVRPTYPALSGRILAYLDRYYPVDDGSLGAGVELRGGTKSIENVPNGYGDTTAGGVLLRAGGVYNGDTLKGEASARVLVDHGGAVGRPERAYVAFGSSAVQLDIGMRDHWTAPGTLDSPLASNTPETYPSLTLSNTKPFDFGGMRYEFFLGQLSGHDTIMLGSVASPGRPLFASTHLSFSIHNAVELGLTRNFIFGGGARTVNFTDFLDAFFNPTGKDNVGLGSCNGTNPNCEFGDQMMMVTSSFKLDYAGTPFQLYTHLGAEDTARGSPFEFGNTLLTLGLYLPWLTTSDQLTVEYSDFQSGWMVHHIYRDGATNNGRVIGPWWADLQGSLLGMPGSAASVNWIHDTDGARRYTVLARSLTVDSATGTHHGYQVEAAVSMMRWGGSTSYSVIFGERVDATRYGQVRVGYAY